MRTILHAIAVLNDSNCWVKGYYATVLFFTPNRILEQSGELEAFARKSADIASALFSAKKRRMAAGAE